MRARAPGKLVVSGAYAVLHGAPAVVAAVDRYVTADASRAPEHVPAEVLAAVEQGLVERAAWLDASRLRAAWPDGSTRKLGLGSSAALLVANLLVSPGSRAPEPFSAQWVRAAVHAHRAAQGGGSGIDVVASALGGVQRFSLDATRTPSWESTRFPEALAIHVLWTGTEASTRELVGRVRELELARPRDWSERMRHLESAAHAVARARDASDWIEGLDAQSEGLFALGREAQATIVPHGVRDLALLARSHGCALLPSGAGGGDVVLLAGRQGDDVAATQVIDAAKARGLELVPLRLGAPGASLLGDELSA